MTLFADMLLTFLSIQGNLYGLSGHDPENYLLRVKMRS